MTEKEKRLQEIDIAIRSLLLNLAKKDETYEQVIGQIEILARERRYLTNAKSLVKVSPEEAAERMEVSPQFIREGLKQGKFSFGTSFTMTGNSYIAYIDRNLFENYIHGNLPYNIKI